MPIHLSIDTKSIGIDEITEDLRYGECVETEYESPIHSYISHTPVPPKVYSGPTNTWKLPQPTQLPQKHTPQWGRTTYKPQVATQPESEYTGDVYVDVFSKERRRK